jgi:hypothetical protein
MALSLSGTTGIVSGNIASDAVTTSQILNANVTPAKLSQPMTLGTAKAYNWNGLTTNTSLDFTGIPSWAKRVTLMFNGLRTSGTSAPRIRLGTSSGFVPSGYLGSCFGANNAGFSNVAFSLGFDINDGATAAATRFGTFTFSCIDTNNNWILIGSQAQGNAPNTSLINGTVPLGGTLTQIRITTANGSDTFDAGSINIIYEG